MPNDEKPDDSQNTLEKLVKEKDKSQNTLEKLVKEKEAEIKRISWPKIEPQDSMFQRFKKLIKSFKGSIKTPLNEIYDDWCTVNNFVESVKYDFIDISKDDQEKNKVDKDKIRRVVAAQAYLNLAKCEKDLGQAWKYVNSADKLLPLIVDKENLDQCLIRLRIWDDKLPGDLKKILNITFIIINRMYQSKLLLEIWDKKLPEDLKKVLDELVKKENILFRFEEQNEIWDEDVLKNVSKTLDEVLNRIKEMYKVEELSNASEGSVHNDNDKIKQVQDRILVERRKAEYFRQAVRSQLWNSLNSATSLKISLWHSLTKMLVVSLIFAVFLAEVIFAGSNPDKSWWHFPFFYISFIGYFGGGLSSVLIARGLVIYAPSPIEIKIQIQLRMFIGAAGAFVMYIIIGSGLLSGDYSLLLDDNIYGFLALGISAGFSEQLFVTPLNKISQNLSILGKAN